MIYQVQMKNQTPFKSDNQFVNEKSETKLLNKLMPNDTFSIQNKKKDEEIKSKKDEDFNNWLNLYLITSLMPK